jgi:hypothetical protein
LTEPLLDGTVVAHAAAAWTLGWAAALSWFESAVDAGLGDQDDSAVLGHVVGHSLRD